MNIVRIKVILCLLSILFFFACKKKDKEIGIGEIKGPVTVCYGEQGIEYSIDLESPVDYILWTVPLDAEITEGQGSNKIIVNFGKQAGEVSAVIHDENSQSNTSVIQISIDCTPDKWCRLKNFAGSKRSFAISFAYQNKGYFGAGELTELGTTSYFEDLWEYDPINLTWSQKASKERFDRHYPYRAPGFLIEEKYYIIDMYNPYEKMAVYDPIANIWSYGNSQNREYTYSSGCAYFSLNSNIFAFCGHKEGSVPSDSLHENRDVYRLRDFHGGWPLWEQLYKFPGPARENALAFTVNNTAYITGGYNYYYDQSSNSHYTYLKDLWKYNEQNDSWMRLKDIPFETYENQNFVILNNWVYFFNTKSIIGVSGYQTELFIYKTEEDEWVQISDYPGKANKAMSAFAINGKIYLGLGNYFNSTLYSNEFYSYCPQ